MNVYLTNITEARAKGLLYPLQQLGVNIINPDNDDLSGDAQTVWDHLVRIQSADVVLGWACNRLQPDGLEPWSAAAAADKLCIAIKRDTAETIEHLKQTSMFGMPCFVVVYSIEEALQALIQQQKVTKMMGPNFHVHPSSKGVAVVTDPVEITKVNSEVIPNQDGKPLQVALVIRAGFMELPADPKLRPSYEQLNDVTDGPYIAIVGKNWPAVRHALARHLNPQGRRVDVEIADKAREREAKEQDVPDAACGNGAVPPSPNRG